MGDSQNVHFPKSMDALKILDNDKFYKHWYNNNNRECIPPP